ncbi:hypothetical protein BKA67DRAFT_679088 [Truncatella angustata]|uniref:Uncharacterized protein n=1 Tax=Truncatella angustata TaxID=152316 RepID=A0A9P8UK45_9PEZI|nr:uncharacterized protein BKA67DRAFT_679088 [Truncatella angustata]KAH6653473.1 hypothetical protein BKA67DRAFT_679088 [Truncatella angustata]
MPNDLDYKTKIFQTIAPKDWLEKMIGVGLIPTLIGRNSQIFEALTTQGGLPRNTSGEEPIYLALVLFESERYESQASVSHGFPHKELLLEKLESDGDWIDGAKRDIFLSRSNIKLNVDHINYGESELPLTAVVRRIVENNPNQTWILNEITTSAISYGKGDIEVENAFYDWQKQRLYVVATIGKCVDTWIFGTKGKERD